MVPQGASLKIPLGMAQLLLHSSIEILSAFLIKQLPGLSMSKISQI
jgi:hypothetical protein